LNVSRTREWIGFAAAIALGPGFLFIGDRIPGLIFGAAAGAYILVCLIVVPLLTIAAGRLKFFVWQAATISLALSVIVDNVRINAMHGSEILSATYVFWAFGSLLSSPVPIYFILKPLDSRHRYMACVFIGTIALLLWLGVRHVTN